MKIKFWARSGEKFQEKTERLKKWPGFRSEYSSRKFLFLFFFKISLTYHCYQFQFFAAIFRQPGLICVKVILERNLPVPSFAYQQLP